MCSEVAPRSVTVGIEAAAAGCCGGETKIAGEVGIIGLAVPKGLSTG